MPPVFAPVEWSVALPVAVRMAAAVAVGGLPLAADVPLRVRSAVAVALAIVAVPAAAGAAATGPLLPTIAGEAVVGTGLGLAAAAVFAAASWAGGLLGSVSGLSWADDFAVEGDPQSAGLARLAWWLGLAGFLAAGGHLAVVAGLLDSVHSIPVGTVFAAPGWADRVLEAPAAAFAVALALAGPALVAVIAFHLAAAVCLRTVQFVPGPGLLQGLAAVTVIAALAVGAVAWLDGFGAVARAQVERSTAAGRP
jgi:flagellar biosynthesis protein FliR